MQLEKNPESMFNNGKEHIQIKCNVPHNFFENTWLFVFWK